MSNFVVSAEQAVKVLNEAFQADPDAIKEMINNPVIINEALANHPTIQATSNKEVFTLGITGLLNGIFGIDENGNGPIARIVNNETGELEGFCINTNLKSDTHV